MDQSKERKKLTPEGTLPDGDPVNGPEEQGNPFPWDTPAPLPTPDAIDPTGKLPSWLDVGLAESELAKFEHEIIKRESETEIALPHAPEQTVAGGASTETQAPESPPFAPPSQAETPVPTALLQPDAFPLPPDIAGTEILRALEETPVPPLPVRPPVQAMPMEVAGPAETPDLATPTVAPGAHDSAAPPPQVEAHVEVATPEPWKPPAELAAYQAPLAAAEAPPETAPAAPPPYAPAEPSATILDEMVAAIDATIAPEEEPSVPLLPAPVKSRTRTAEEQLVVFTLGGVDYGVAIGNLREVGRLPSVTPVPNVPSWVLGVANIRGDIVSLVDLRAFLGLEPYGRQTTARLLVARDRQEEVTAGLVVDQVIGIRYVTADRINAATSPIEDRVAPYLRGFTEQDGRLLVLLDLNRLLLSPEMRQFEPI
jgi:purine-binding chemotaxis protein CheW